MSLHQNDHLLWYAYCHCGVVGPMRRTRLAAAMDEGAHAGACSSRVMP